MLPHPVARHRRECVVVIPARFGSTRLPQKMLLRDTGKPLLQYTYEAACAAKRPDAVVVATDHPEIARDVERFGGDGRHDQPRLPERHRPRRRSGPPTAGRTRSSSTCKATSRRSRPRRSIA